MAVAGCRLHVHSKSDAESAARLSSSLQRSLGSVCFVAGFLSIAASIAIWFFLKSEDAGHAERFGIFVGLWAPTFFILSDRLQTRLT
jgi:hypothetical protein